MEEPMTLNRAPVRSGCGQPESAERGRLTRLGKYLLHLDCRVERLD
jgi:hypothetical protein